MITDLRIALAIDCSYAVFLTSLSLATAVISIVIYIRLGLLRFLVLGIGSVAFGLTALLGRASYDLLRSQYPYYDL